MNTAAAMTANAPMIAETSAMTTGVARHRNIISNVIPKALSVFMITPNKIREAICFP